MSTTTKFGTGASGTSWTDPTNANADDAANATYTIAAKNTTGNVNTITNFAFDAAIPVGATINSVALVVEHFVSTGTGIAHLEAAVAVGGTPGSYNTDSTEPTSPTIATYSTLARPGGGSWTRDDLLDGTFEVLLRARSGNNATSVTYSWDYAKVTVDYTPLITLDQAAFRFYNDGIQTGALAVANNGTRHMPLSKQIGAYASTPDSVPNSITGDIDLRFGALVDDSTPSVLSDMIAKSTTDASQFSYVFRLETDGKLRLYWSEDGTTLKSTTSTAALPWTNGTVLYVGVTMDVDDGGGNRVTKFYYTTTYSADITTWTQLGTTVTTVGATSIFDGTAALQAGARSSGGASSAQWAGNVKFAEVRAGINGTVAARFDPDADATDGVTSFASAIGETWTLNGNAAKGAQSANITQFVDTTDRDVLLRVRLQNSGGAGAATDDYKLQYSRNGGDYADVNSSSSYVQALASATLTDQGATTNVLTGGTGSFVAGKVSETGSVDNLQITASNFTELLYAMKLKWNALVNADTLDFKVQRNGSDLAAYTTVPRITISQSVPYPNASPGGGMHNIPCGIGDPGVAVVPQTLHTIEQGIGA